MPYDIFQKKSPLDLYRKLLFKSIAQTYNQAVPGLLDGETGPQHFEPKKVNNLYNNLYLRSLLRA